MVTPLYEKKKKQVLLKNSIAFVQVLQHNVRRCLLIYLMCSLRENVEHKLDGGGDDSNNFLFRISSHHARLQSFNT